MEGQSAGIAAGMSQDRLYAVAHQFAKKAAGGEPARDDNARIEESSSAVAWQSSDDAKTTDIHGRDIVYLTAISSALAENEVEAASAKQRLSFKEKAAGILKEKYLKLAMDVFSHNYFVAELAKMGVGILGFQLGQLGVSPAEIGALMGEARRQKTAAVSQGLAQVASEKVLFGVVTGANI